MVETPGKPRIFRHDGWWCADYLSVNAYLRREERVVLASHGSFAWICRRAREWQEWQELRARARD